MISLVGAEGFEPPAPCSQRGPCRGIPNKINGILIHLISFRSPWVHGIRDPIGTPPQIVLMETSYTEQF